MSSGALEVLQSGPQALIQDAGRRGSQHLGIGVSGAADRHAAGWANRLMGNSDRAPVIEVCLGNFRIRFDRPCHFSLTGADMHWKLDGVPLDNWRSHFAPAGAVLESGFANNGVRAYLAFAGGLSVPNVCGSSATSMGEGLGGLRGDGQPLRPGDRLEVHRTGKGLPTSRCVPIKFQRGYTESLQLRVVASNQFFEFSPESREHFFATRFRVAPESDRMGVRMQGAALPSAPENLVSEAVCPGVVQVPASGLPIVLMPDCQTIGGYPKLGHVYRVDLDRLAQARPGASVQFVLGDRAQAQQELILQRQFFDRWGAE